MNKFLSIFAATGLLVASAGAAQADIVTTTGTAPDVCALSVKNGVLKGDNPARPNKLGTTWGTQPEVQTVCNAAGHTIKVGFPVFTVDGQPYPTGHKVFGGYAPGAGVYQSIAETLSETASPDITVNTTTSNGGDKFRLNANIEATNSSLLIGGAYVATIDVTLTPQ